MGQQSGLHPDCAIEPGAGSKYRWSRIVTLGYPPVTGHKDTDKTNKVDLKPC